MAARSATRARPPGQMPRARLRPKPRWSGAMTAMPRAARAAPTVSNAWPWSPKPWRAMTTARGRPSPAGDHWRKGRRSPSAMTIRSPSKYGITGPGPGVCRRGAQAARIRARLTTRPRTRFRGHRGAPARPVMAPAEGPRHVSNRGRYPPNRFHGWRYRPNPTRRRSAPPKYPAPESRAAGS